MSSGRAWYREPLMWLVVGIPASSVLLGAGMIWAAVATSDGLVADDYYRRGLEINRSLARDRVAAERGLSADLRLDPGGGEVRARLASGDGTVHPDALRAGFYHATRAGFDHTLLLRRVGTASYSAPLPALAPGHWYVQIEAGDWRLTGSLRVPGEGRLRLQPAPGREP